MKFLIMKGAKEICGRRLYQDPLEQTFSTFRLKGGSRNNPDLATVLQTRISVHAQKQVALPSRRGNTEVKRDEITIDDSSLPKKKKRVAFESGGNR